MIVFSKRLNIPAKTAIAESIRRNNLEAPQREIERQWKPDEGKHERPSPSRSLMP
jgi:hypothetical protein